MKANRKHKDSLFTTLFGEPDRFIELYNALTGSAYPLNTPIQPAMLTDILFMDRQNDVAFVISNKIVVLIEHQSTICNNLPLRLLLYIARVYELIVDTNVIYKSTLIKIPKPEFIVLYNGVSTFPDEKTLLLSDAYEQPLTPGLGSSLDLSVRVVNINKGRNQLVVNNSTHLKGYVEFLAMVRANQKAGMALSDSIEKAVNDCIAQDILANFLRIHGAEVVNMLTAEFNIDIAKQVWLEEGRDQKAILLAVKAIKQWKCSLNEAIEFAELDSKYRIDVIAALNKQGIAYTE